MVMVLMYPAPRARHATWMFPLLTLSAVVKVFFLTLANSAYHVPFNPDAYLSQVPHMGLEDDPTPGLHVSDVSDSDGYCFRVLSLPPIPCHLS